MPDDRWNQQLARLRVLTANRLERLEMQYKRGTWTEAVYLRRRRELLTQSHTEAAGLAVRKAGGSILTVGQEQAIERIVERQERFLERFGADIRADRYARKKKDGTGGEGAAARKRRFAMYGAALTGTANAIWATAQGDVLALWQLGTAEHCRDCLAEAAKGWRPLSDFTRYPGDGSTACLTRCRCDLITRGGEDGFSNA